MGCASSSHAPCAQSPQKQDRDDHRVAETQRKGSSPSAKDAKNVNEVKPAAPAEPASPHDASKVDSAPTANAAELHLARVSVNCHGPWILLRAAGIEHHLADVDQMTGAQMHPQKQDRNDHGVAETREAPAKGGSPSAKDAKNVNEVKPVAPAEPAAPHDASKVDA
eukprot:gene18264-28152_t